MAALYSALADAVVAAHLTYLGVLGFGGLAACRWRWLLPVHLSAVAWGLGALLFRYGCPFTSLELELRQRAGEALYEDGFIRHYIRGVLFPEALTPFVVAVVAAAVVVGWVRFALTAAGRTPAWGFRSPIRTAEGSGLSSRSPTTRTRSSPPA